MKTEAEVREYRDAFNVVISADPGSRVTDIYRAKRDVLTWVLGELGPMKKGFTYEDYVRQCLAAADSVREKGGPKIDGN